jgi:putative membrane protein
MFKQSVFLAAAALLVPTALLAQAPNPATAAPRPQTQAPVQAGARGATSDQTFANEAAIAGMTEVELGKMATQQGSNARVKSFGTMMVTDHTKAGDELRAIAKSKGMTLPTMLDAEHQATRDKLAKLSGAEFDRAYMDTMVTAHQTVEKKMMTEANSGADPEFKAFAAKAVPTVQTHLKMAQEIKKEVAAK